MTRLVTYITGKSATLGAAISAMGCTVCFPAAASIGAALGLGVLAHWEGLFFHVLLPAFVAVALLANLIGWFTGRPWWRNLPGVLGPALVLVARYPLWQYHWHNGVAISDLSWPAGRRCAVGWQRLAAAAKRSHV